MADKQPVPLPPLPLVERLREVAESPIVPRAYYQGWLIEAADEIARLENELAEWKKGNKDAVEEMFRQKAKAEKFEGVIAEIKDSMRELSQAFYMPQAFRIKFNNILDNATVKKASE